MKKWLGAIAVLGLAGLVCLFVFNRSTRLDSTKQSAPTTNAVVDTTKSPAAHGAPSTASASRDSSPLQADAVVGIPSASANAAFNPPARPTVPLPEPSVPESELPQLSPQIALENVRATFRDFRSRFASNPVGTNEEITRALNGENPGQTRFLRMEDGMRLNAKGELIDSWGTPYFFHQLSATEMEIHCAGPDKRMWTSDDLVIK